MAIYLVPTPTRKDIQLVPLFNATTSTINFGVATSQDLVAQTTLAYVNLAGSGENGFSYIWSKLPSASPNGPRLLVAHNAGSPFLVMAAHSTGSAANPQLAATAGSWLYNTPAHIAATWNGGVLGADMALYQGFNGAPLAAPGTGVVNGSGTAGYGVGLNFHIGNREGTDRTTNGVIYYVARWNRLLPVEQLRVAQLFGPLSVPDGLVLCWANNQDYSPTRLTYSSQTAVVYNQGAMPPNTLLQWDWRGPAQWPMGSIADSLLGQACL